MRSIINYLHVLVIMVLIGCNRQPSEKLEVIGGVEMGQELTEHGQYMVNVLGCADCHTPKKMTENGPQIDMEKYMMGFNVSEGLPPIPENVPIGPWVLFKGDLTAAIGPWGTSYAGNLTPHETGIGTWTLEQFSKALKEAKFKGLENTRPIMPPMPRHYAYLTDTDIAAIFTYLKSIQPIENVVPGYRPPVPQS